LLYTLPTPTRNYKNVPAQSRKISSNIRPAEASFSKSTDTKSYKLPNLYVATAIFYIILEHFVTLLGVGSDTWDKTTPV
jgi:hypothetical protein